MRIDPARFGLLAFLGTLTMLFVGLTSAYLVRRASADWAPIEAPRVLFWSTAALLLSSLTLEGARWRLRGWDPPRALLLMGATGLLGALFVSGQLAAWRALSDQGVFLATNPHSSFFFVLTGLHALHLLGGLAWFLVALHKLAGLGYVPGEDGLGLFALYWHFLAALWAYLLALLFVL